MLVQAEQEDILSGGLGQGNKFSIASSAKAFEILSSNLYANKILAVIREISCNAADAHKVAGQPLGKIEVHLPTYAEPFFSVRDYGPGLTDAEVKHLYTTYFQSSKDASNELIGGFGLGSKAPFSVADQFTLTAWQDGQQRQYVCYKDGGVPAINAIGSKPSVLARGFEVRVAVPSTQLSTWAVEAQQFFGWWPEAPTFVGHKPTITCWLDASNFSVRSADSVGGVPAWAFTNSGGPRVLMGLVPYKLEFSAIPLLTSAEIGVYNNTNMLLAFEIGELEINPSRETLSYNPTTCVAIKKRLDHIRAHLEGEFNKTLTGCTTLLEARFKTFSQDSAQIRTLLERLNGGVKAKGAMWQGKLLHQQVSVDLQKDFGSPLSYFAATKSTYRTTWRKFADHHSYQHSVRHQPTLSKGAVNLYLWSATTPTAKTYKTVQYWFEQNPAEGVDFYGNRSTRFELAAHIFVPPAGSALTLVDVNKEMLARGLPLLEDISTLPPPPKVAPSGKVKVASKTTGYSFVNGSWSRTEADIDLAGGGYFVEFFDGQPQVSTPTMKDMLEFIKGGDTAQLIGLPRRKLEVQKLKKQLAADGWTQFTHASTDLFDATLVEQVAFCNNINNAIRTVWQFKNELEAILKIYEKQPTKVPPGWELAAKALLKYKWSPYWHLNDFVSSLPSAWAPQIKAGNDAAKALVAHLRVTKGLHPLLNHLGDWTQVPADPLLDYLNRA